MHLCINPLNQENMLQNRANIFSYVQAQTILTDWLSLCFSKFFTYIRNNHSLELHKKYFPIKRSTFFSEFSQIFQNSFFAENLSDTVCYIWTYKITNHTKTLIDNILWNSTDLLPILAPLIEDHQIAKPIYCTRKETELKVANYYEIKIRAISSKNQLQTSRN